jgi:hypothetical protein
MKPLLGQNFSACGTRKLGVRRQLRLEAVVAEAVPAAAARRQHWSRFYETVLAEIYG